MADHDKEWHWHGAALKGNLLFILEAEFLVVADVGERGGFEIDGTMLKISLKWEGEKSV